ncbi:helix-turn-helix transcriptional regulator [Halorussus lipolyticus]|uniref:helix-turn-helix transcriptional regulator n=1 Tax=Halorussus lipolyticus TaxID=3034024 RepID=UPI0023E8E8D0|nr:hypothetical protein [Halorussus sp. DT80]
MGARQFALFAAALCLVAAVGTPIGGAVSERPIEGAVSASPMDSPTTPATARSQMQQVTPDTVVLDVQVYENGTATWEVVYRTRLDDPETTAAFRGYKADIENNSERYSQQFVGRMNSTIRSAEESTDREMSGTNYSVRAEIREFPQRYGLVVYSFKWRGFADVSGDRIRVGDSLSGLILNEKTRLLVKWPEGYEATTVEPEPETGYEKRDQAVVWNGPIEFASNEPRVVVSTPGTGWFDLPENLPWGLFALVAGGLGVLVALGGGGWWLYRSRDEETDDADAEPPEDLLSNEERVLRLLERRGGRVKQKAVVDELGWTEAKTSQVVGSLREQGKIESFRLGRENVLALAQEQRES